MFLTQPADGEFLGRVERTLRKRAHLHRLGGIERRLLTERVAYPNAQFADRLPRLDRRRYRALINDSGGQLVAIGDRQEDVHWTFRFQGQAGFDAAEHLRLANHLVLGDALGLLERTRAPVALLARLLGA